ncbi:MAG: hypothetical protein PPP56_11070 [Longimonas sp.]|uniref:hypothetical protein n=1 Tax=Longimonas sp. TaxID=2039626 RepID=UPI00335D8F50
MASTDASADDAATTSALASRVAQLSTFAALGTLSCTQNVTHTVLRSIGSIESTEPDLVAEETLCLLATVTARAVAVGLRAEPEQAEALEPVLLRLPFQYRDYLIGHAMVEEEDPDLAATGEAVRERLAKKQRFYETHFPEGQFPGPRALGDKLELWMGRVSPPGLPTTPQERLQELPVHAPIVAHAKLMLAYTRQGGLPGDTSDDT